MKSAPSLSFSSAHILHEISSAWGLRILNYSVQPKTSWLVRGRSAGRLCHGIPMQEYRKYQQRAENAGQLLVLWAFFDKSSGLSFADSLDGGCLLFLLPNEYQHESMVGKNQAYSRNFLEKHI